jgi:predicted Fe-Mo cluster-binding NifX family protein
MDSKSKITDKKGKDMLIAIPVVNGQLSMHFGHCENFALIEVNEESGEIISEKQETPPPHEPGVLPRWLTEQGANVILAGGMGRRAQDMFESRGLKVVVGVQPGAPADIVSAYVSGTLETGGNVCDH